MNLRGLRVLKPQQSGGIARLVECLPLSCSDCITSAGLTLLTKLKPRSIIGTEKPTQREQNSYCFLSQPQLRAHALLAHRHLSLSRALASSPTEPTRPGQHLSQPNIHLLPAGIACICHRGLFKAYGTGDIW